MTIRSTRRASTRAANALYQELFASSPDGILLIDAETRRIIEFNDAACRQLGYTREEFGGLHISDFEASETPEVIEAHAQATLRDGLTEFDTLHRTKAGEIRHVHVWAKPFDLDGRAAFHAIFRDVTDRVRAEESERESHARLRAVLNHAPITIFALDRHGVFTLSEGKGLEGVGLAPGENVGTSALDLYADLPFLQPDGTTIAGRDVVGRVLAGETVTGVTRLHDDYFDNCLLPHHDAEGRVIGLIGVATVITERRQLETQVRQAQKMESVGQLASGIAHDFNNLLTVINGVSSLVLERIREDDPVRADVQEIHRAGERAAALTRQLLAFSRQQILAPRVMNVNAAIAGMDDLLRRVLGEDIDLLVVPAPGLRNVKADPGQIEQVVTNLAVNARDAMPRGGRLTIETRNVEIGEDDPRRTGAGVPPGSYVLLAVSDTGVGMDEATRARIFDPFFTTKAPAKGTGLGLSTVYGIVKQSQGFIDVSSEVGQGTRFTIYLPQASETTASAPPGPAANADAGTETILVVEDDAALRTLATRMLEPAGYTVLGAATGDEALRLLDRHREPVHLLLSDVVMPGMSGRHLAEQVARIRPGMRVLYMSGYMNDTILRHGLMDAQVHFLIKPFTSKALIRKVREVLDLPA